MDFFEKLTKKASETYKSAAEKTGKLANETKLKMKISDAKSKINELYKEIGKKVYEKFALDGNLDIKSDIEEELNRVKELADQIVEYEKQILELSDMKECVKCHSKMERTAKFCQACGAEQPQEEAKEVEVVGVENNETAENVAENVEETVENMTSESTSSEESTDATEKNSNDSNGANE